MSENAIELKKEEAVITAKNLNAVRIFEQLGNDISEEYKILKNVVPLAERSRLELLNCELQNEKLEFIVKKFQE